MMLIQKVVAVIMNLDIGSGIKESEHLRII